MFSRTVKDRAFTLLELIVVIVVLGILAAIAIPTFARVIEKSEDEATLTTLRAVAREAQALEGFDRNGWDSTDVEGAATDMDAAAAPGVYAITNGWVATPGAGADPGAKEITYLLSGDTLALSMLSDSGRVCVLGLSYTAIGNGYCEAPAESGSVLEKAAATNPAALYPTGASTSPAAPTSPTAPTSPPAPTVNAPSAASDVTAVAGNGQATVSFTPGADGGAPTTHTVTSTPGGFTASGVSPVVVPGLSNGTSYTFAVTSTNSAGTATSSPSNAVTPKAPTVDVTGQVSTVAGSGTAGYADGSATAASFANPNSLASDGTYMYVADNGNDRIRKVHLTTGETTTLAGDGVQRSVDGVGTNASFHGPHSVVVDAGYLYVSEFHGNRIRKVELSTGTVSTLAGTGTAGGADGPGATATFHNPGPVTIRNGILYTVDTTGTAGFRSIDLSTGVVSTVAAGLGSSVRGLAVDANYIYYTSRSAIRRYDFSTRISDVFIGSASTAGYVDGTGTAARFNTPAGIVLSAGTLYVADQQNNRVRKIDIASRAVTTVTGTGTASSVDGPAGTATLNGPSGLASLGEDLYITEVFGHKIRKVS